MYSSSGPRLTVYVKRSVFAWHADIFSRINALSKETNVQIFLLHFEKDFLDDPFSEGAFLAKSKSQRPLYEMKENISSVSIPLSPECYRSFFMLNSAEYAIFSSHKSQINNNCKFFLAKQSKA